MSNSSDAANRGADRPANRWERRWGLLSLVLVLAAVATVVYNQWASYRGRGGVAPQRVLAELKPAPCLELKRGALKGWNVLLVSVDTTRANHLNSYGYPYTKTPVLNDLARHGVLYSQAFTPSPATLPAHCSLLTGLYPLHHGARANGTFTLAAEQRTLAEWLREAGYRTGAAISAFVLDSRFGLEQGFETYDDDLTVGVQHSPQMFRERAAELTNVPARQWLREHGQQRFFLWVHYFDPHAPYAPPEPYRSKYAEGPYDGEIDYADEQIGKLLAVLTEIGVRDRTLVIVVSDHGEGLGQHGEQTHSLLVYDSTLHVPMILSGPPPFPQGRVVHDQVCLTDIMPTVLELVGLPAPKGLDGVSLLEPVGTLRPTICIETLASMLMHGWAPLIGIRRADYKFILAPEKEVYDLHTDPLEQDNLHARQATRALELYQELIRLVGSDDPYTATAVRQDQSMDEETRLRLEGLGYVASGSAQADDPAALPDPKRMIGQWERVQHAVNLKLAGRLKEAVKILEDAVEKVPADIYARQNLAGCYGIMGEREKAIAVIEPALKFCHEDTRLLVTKADLHLSKNEIQAAQAIYEQVKKAEPENTEVLLALARISYLRGAVDEALAELQKIVEINPGTGGPPAYNLMGMIHVRAGRLDEARAAYQAALKIDGLNGPAHDGLANVLIAERNYDDAMKHLQLALRFSPLQLDAMATLGGLYREKGALGWAAFWCQQALALNPKFPAALNNLGLIRRQEGDLDKAEALYREAIAAAPRMAAPHLNLAQLLLDRNDERNAGAEFLAAVKADPNDVHALTNFATFAYRRSRLKEAAGLYQRAAHLQPDYALPHKYLGLIYAHLGRPRASIRHLEKALELAPDDADADNMRQVVATMQAQVAAQPDRADAPLTPPATPGLTPPTASDPAAPAAAVDTADGQRDADRAAAGGGPTP